MSKVKGECVFEYLLLSIADAWGSSLLSLLMNLDNCDYREGL